jgi:hypothetical protein
VGLNAAPVEGAARASTHPTFSSFPSPRSSHSHTSKRNPSVAMTLSDAICDLARCPPELHDIKPPDFERGPVSTQSILQENIFILPRALLPLVLQQISYWLLPGALYVSLTEQRAG